LAPPRPWCRMPDVGKKNGGKANYEGMIYERKDGRWR
jgi:hypothetical protein